MNTYIPSLLGLLSTPFPHPTPLGHHSTNLSSRCYIAASPSYLTHISVYIPVSQLVPPSPSPPVSTCLFSTSASLFLPWK